MLKWMRHPSIEITQKSLGVTLVKIECTTTQYNSEKDLFLPCSVLFCECKDANIITEWEYFPPF